MSEGTPTKLPEEVIENWTKEFRSKGFNNPQEVARAAFEFRESLNSQDTSPTPTTKKPLPNLSNDLPRSDEIEIIHIATPQDHKK